MSWLSEALHAVDNLLKGEKHQQIEEANEYQKKLDAAYEKAIGQASINAVLEQWNKSKEKLQSSEAKIIAQMVTSEAVTSEAGISPLLIFGIIAMILLWRK